MLHVLTAQSLAEERERAIQRRLRKREVWLEARAAKAAQPDRLAHAPAAAADRPSGARPPAAATVR
jgi:hypothetical protein